MGVSNNGILVYGIALNDDGGLPEWCVDENGESIDFDEFVLVKLGADRPKNWQEKSAMVDKCPVDLVAHCSYDYPMYILAVRGTEITSRRGYPVEVTSLDVDPEKVKAFYTYCEENGITIPEDAKLSWLLCTMNG